MKPFIQYIAEKDVRDDPGYKNFNHPPCWAFQQPTIKQLYDLVWLFQNDMLPKKDPSYTIMKALDDWVEGDWLEGGRLKSKETTIKALLPIMACKGKADWMKWSGMCWRGLSKPITDIKESYKFTDEFKMMEGDLWIKATTKYKSKMPMQSWTTKMKTAIHFSKEQNGIRNKTWLPVVFEYMMLSSECLMSPAAVKKIHPDFNEAEVIRVSSKATAVTVWVNLTPLLENGIWNGIGSVEKILGKIGIGKNIAKKLLANKKFMSHIAELGY